MERVRFVTHDGKQILIADLTHCSATEVESIVRALPDRVTSQPLQSVRLLVDFSGASFDEEALRTMKETAAFDKPYIKKVAWVGANSLPDSFLELISQFSGREFPLFKNVLVALDWLAKD